MGWNDARAPRALRVFSAAAIAIADPARPGRAFMRSAGGVGE